MKNNTSPQVPAFSLASLKEFLDTYNPIVVIEEKGYLEIDKNEKKFFFYEVDFVTLESAENALENLFEFLSPADESVKNDWILHVERWEYANEFPDTPQPENDERENVNGSATVEDYGPDE